MLQPQESWESQTCFYVPSEGKTIQIPLSWFRKLQLSGEPAEGPWSREAGSYLPGDWSDVQLILPVLSTSIEGEYVPMEGDEVTYKMCPIPPKNQKFQAVEVVLTQLAPHTPHETWSGQVVGS